MNLFLSTFGETYDREMIQRELNMLKNNANIMYENNELTNYPIFNEKDDLISKVILTNNIKEFTY